MKERPILFSAPMVRAILAGTKTQTRRMVKPQPLPELRDATVDQLGAHWVKRLSDDVSLESHVRCPYGAAGGKLWVRETIERGPLLFRMGEMRDTAIYAADGAETKLDTWPWQRDVLPSIHCPRGLSRITLEVTDVRVERLQDITERDVMAEGIEQVDGALDDAEIVRLAKASKLMLEDARASFAALWESINGAGSWVANPWVWVVSFRRVEQ